MGAGGGWVVASGIGHGVVSAARRLRRRAGRCTGAGPGLEACLWGEWCELSAWRGLWT